MALRQDLAVVGEDNPAACDHGFDARTRPCLEYSAAIGCHTFVAGVTEGADLRCVRRSMLDHHPGTGTERLERRRESCRPCRATILARPDVVHELDADFRTGCDEP